MRSLFISSIKNLSIHLLFFTLQISVFNKIPIFAEFFLYPYIFLFTSFNESIGCVAHLICATLFGLLLDIFSYGGVSFSFGLLFTSYSIYIFKILIKRLNSISEKEPVYLYNSGVRCFFVFLFLAAFINRGVIVYMEQGELSFSIKFLKNIAFFSLIDCFFISTLEFIFLAITSNKKL